MITEKDEIQFELLTNGFEQIGDDCFEKDNICVDYSNNLFALWVDDEEIIVNAPLDIQTIFTIIKSLCNVK